MRSPRSVSNSRAAEDLAALNPDLVRVLGPRARAVVSEPICKFSEIWEAVPESTALRIRAGEVE